MLHCLLVTLEGSAVWDLKDLCFAFILFRVLLAFRARPRSNASDQLQ